MAQTRSQTSRANSTPNQQPPVQHQPDNQGDHGDDEDNGPPEESSESTLEAPPPPPETISTQLLGFLNGILEWFWNMPAFKAFGTGFAVLILALLGAWMFGWRESSSVNRELGLASFEDQYRAIIGRFPAQSQNTKESLYVAMKHILEIKEPRDPSSMIVLIPPSLASSPFPTCFIQVVGGMLNRVHRGSSLPVKVMNQSSFRGRDMENIQSELRNYFRSGGTSVLVSEIQNFPKEDHLTLFHSFCDSTHAPVKRAAFFFLVPIPKSLYNSNGWEEEVTALGNGILETAWANVLVWDKIHPLLSRIGSWGTIQLAEGDSCHPQ